MAGFETWKTVTNVGKLGTSETLNNKVQLSCADEEISTN